MSMYLGREVFQDKRHDNILYEVIVLEQRKGYAVL